MDTGVKVDRWRLFRETGPLSVILLVLLPISLPAIAQTEAASAQSPADRASAITTFESKKTDDVAGPKLKAELRQKQLSRQSAEKLDETIETLKELIAASSDQDPDKLDYYMNLADSYWEKSEGFFELAYDEQLEQGIFEAERDGNATEAERLRRQQTKLLNTQTEYREKTVDTYTAVEQKFPNAPKIDEVLYYLGMHQMMAKREEAGYQTYVRLVQKRPQSPYIPDALVNIGEYFFNRNDFDTALAFYEKVYTGFPTSNVYGFALYKAGWCYFNMGEYDQSLDKFLQVIQFSDSAAGSQLKNRIELRSEAQKDLVRAYSMTGNPDKAMMFFKQIAPEIHLELGQALADMYVGQGKFDGAIKLYRQLINEEPSSYKVLRYQRKIVTATYKTQNKPGTVKEVQRMLALYQSVGASAPADWLKEEKSEVEGELRVIATTWHKEAEQPYNEETMGRAADLYREYLRLFPEGEHIYPITMNFAILLKTLKKFDEAAQQFDRVIDLDPKGKYSGEAAYLAMYSYYRVLDINQGKVKTGTDAEGLMELEIPELEAKMIKACERYVDVAGPDGEDVALAHFAAGKLYYNYNHFDKAIPHLEKMVGDYKTHPNSPDAAKLLLSSFNLKHEFSKLEDWAVKLAGTNLASGELNTTITKIRDQAEFNRCFDFEQTKENVRAGDCFMGYAAKYPDTELLDRALFNAAVNYTRAKRVEKALIAHGELYNKRNSSPLAPKALFSIGEIYRSLAIYSEASSFYEQFIQNHPKDPNVEQALRYASIFRKALGEYDAAVANYGRYLSLFPKSKQAPSVNFDVGLIYEKQKNYKELEKHYTKFLQIYQKSDADTDLVLGAMLKIGTAMWNRKDYKKALLQFESVITLYNGLKPEIRNGLRGGIAYVAEAQFMLGEKVLMDSRDIKLTSNNLETAFKEKVQRIADARALFVKVIELQQPHWVIAGLNRVGLAYEELARTIEESPAPKGLNEDQKTLYRDDLAVKAAGIKEKAIAAYNECLATARQLEWFNDYADQAAASLAKLDYAFKFIKEYRVRPTQYQYNSSPPSFRAHVTDSSYPRQHQNMVADGDPSSVGSNAATTTR